EVVRDRLPLPLAGARLLPERRNRGRGPGGARRSDRRRIEHPGTRGLRVAAQGVVGAVGSEQGIRGAPEAVARPERDALEPRNGRWTENRTSAVNEPEHEGLSAVDPWEGARRVGFGAVFAVEHPLLHVVRKRPAALTEVDG